MLVDYAETIVMIDVNRQGEYLAREIHVIVHYVTSVDDSYGEDADGRRGVPLIEREILDVYIDANILKFLSAELAEWAIASAREIFFLRRIH